ncbi:MAG: signal peptidase I [Candidatus Omnitrophica bacterium]|nr:signal peptidase I [Candidatus Omnitrophota bacterium]
MAQEKKHWLREWSESILIALAIALFIRTFLVEAFKIPSGSMRPTLEVKDRIFVNKLVYRFSSPERGDIVVFKYTEDPKRYFVKRLAAVGNENIEIIDGNIVVDGDVVKVPDIFLEHYYYNRGRYGAQNKTVQVPDGHYYFLGDNSAFSQDSRYWGFVPDKYIVGKAFLRFWPLYRVGLVR